MSVTNNAPHTATSIVSRAASLAVLALAMLACVSAHLVQVPGLEPRGGVDTIPMVGMDGYPPNWSVEGQCGVDGDSLVGTVDNDNQRAEACSLMFLEWKIIGDEIEFEMFARVTGWLSIGIQDPENSNLLDTYVGNVIDGEVSVEDGTTDGLTEPVRDPVQNAMVVSGTQSEFGTKIVFRRKLVSSDSKNDVDITNQQYLVAWAVHLTQDNRSRFHSYRGLWKIAPMAAALQRRPTMLDRNSRFNHAIPSDIRSLKCILFGMCRQSVSTFAEHEQRRMFLQTYTGQQMMREARQQMHAQAVKEGRVMKTQGGSWSDPRDPPTTDDGELCVPCLCNERGERNPPTEEPPSSQVNVPETQKEDGSWGSITGTMPPPPDGKSWFRPTTQPPTLVDAGGGSWGGRRLLGWGNASPRPEVQPDNGCPLCTVCKPAEPVPPLSLPATVRCGGFDSKSVSQAPTIINNGDIYRFVVGMAGSDPAARMTDTRVIRIRRHLLSGLTKDTSSAAPSRRLLGGSWDGNDAPPSDPSCPCGRQRSSGGTRTSLPTGGSSWGGRRLASWTGGDGGGSTGETCIPCRTPPKSPNPPPRLVGHDFEVSALCYPSNAVGDLSGKAIADKGVSLGVVRYGKHNSAEISIAIEQAILDASPNGQAGCSIAVTYLGNQNSVCYDVLVKSNPKVTIETDKVKDRPCAASYGHYRDSAPLNKLNIPNNNQEWGWATVLPSASDASPDASITMDLVKLATDNDVSKGEMVGTVTASLLQDKRAGLTPTGDPKCRLIVVYSMENGHTLSFSSLYAGSQQVPTRDVRQFPYIHDDLDAAYSDRYEIEDMACTNVNVVVYGETCHTTVVGAVLAAPVSSLSPTKKASSSDDNAGVIVGIIFLIGALLAVPLVLAYKRKKKQQSQDDMIGLNCPPANTANNMFAPPEPAPYSSPFAAQESHQPTPSTRAPTPSSRPKKGDKSTFSGKKKKGTKSDARSSVDPRNTQMMNSQMMNSQMMMQGQPQHARNVSMMGAGNGMMNPNNLPMAQGGAIGPVDTSGLPGGAGQAGGAPKEKKKFSNKKNQNNKLIKQAKKEAAAQDAAAKKARKAAKKSELNGKKAAKQAIRDLATANGGGDGTTDAQGVPAAQGGANGPAGAAAVPGGQGGGEGAPNAAAVPGGLGGGMTMAPPKKPEPMSLQMDANGNLTMMPTKEVASRQSTLARNGGGLAALTAAVQSGQGAADGAPNAAAVPGGEGGANGPAGAAAVPGGQGGGDGAPNAAAVPGGQGGGEGAPNAAAVPGGQGGGGGGAHSRSSSFGSQGGGGTMTAEMMQAAGMGGGGGGAHSRSSSFGGQGGGGGTMTAGMMQAAGMGGGGGGARSRTNSYGGMGGGGGTMTAGMMQAAGMGGGGGSAQQRHPSQYERHGADTTVPVMNLSHQLDIKKNYARRMSQHQPTGNAHEDDASFLDGQSFASSS